MVAGLADPAPAATYIQGEQRMSGDTSGGTQVLQACDAELNALLGRLPALRFASLSTVDGRAVLAAGRLTDTAVERVAAVSSSLLALGEAFARETAGSAYRHTTITADDGLIVVARVPSSRQRLALAVGCDHGGNLALLLGCALDSAAALTRIVDRAA
ncbi:MAG: hypothetical protein BGP24_16585 [Lysobacterales bacterium 69-70]|nr:roadblock/LC7 domain-containing protein [Xanthomonadaceae bacterium]ODV21941.1 MAG: hypothetical protein ABT27_03330 [Xanthomonadaceae bacterium SCN 69-25]OJZ02844.1 MAG: hypothetical protein BGP24_16585 [Xanthomonadales bacterium 69-70]